MSKSNKEDITSSIVIEMLVDVGIPWEEDFVLFLSCCPDFVGEWR